MRNGETREIEKESKGESKHKGECPGEKERDNLLGDVRNLIGINFS